MLAVSFVRHIAEATRRFRRADEGNLAVIFAYSLVPLLCFMGAAIDYSRANKARTSMQSALDSTALMLSKDLSNGTIQTSDIPTKAQAYFAALYTDKDAQQIAIDATYTAESSSRGSTIQLSGSAAAAAADNASRRPISTTGATIRRTRLKPRRRHPRIAPGLAASTIAIRITTPRTAHPEQAAEHRPRNSMQNNGQAAFRPPRSR